MHELEKQITDARENNIDCDIYGYVSFVNESGDGGFYVPIDIVRYIQDELSKRGYIMKNKREEERNNARDKV